MEHKIFKSIMIFLAPVMTAALLLGIYASGGLYPFGGKSLAWGDMDQQFLPLLNEFLDMLAGKDGFLLSMLNGGGGKWHPTTAPDHGICCRCGFTTRRQENENELCAHGDPITL